MRFLLDGRNFPSSEPDASLPENGGDVFGRGLDPDIPLVDEVPPTPMPAPVPDAATQKDKLRLIEEAKKIMRGQANQIPGRIATKAGAPLNVVNAVRKDTPEGRQVVKDYAQEKVRNFAKDKIGNKIANKGLRTGFKKGISEGASTAAKSAAKTAGKAVGKEAVKVGTKVATKAGVKLGGAGLVEGGVAAAGVASGAATFGLGFVLSIFLDIAISLGINDAVDAGFELTAGHLKQATFLAIRAAYKVMMFFYFLITVILLLSVAGAIIGIPMLIALNIYTLAGYAFKKLPWLQGMVWWEVAVMVLFDIVGIIIAAALLGGMIFYLCQSTGLNVGGFTGTLSNAVVNVYDKVNGTQIGATFNALCSNINIMPRLQ